MPDLFQFQPATLAQGQAPPAPQQQAVPALPGLDPNDPQTAMLLAAARGQAAPKVDPFALVGTPLAARPQAPAPAAPQEGFRPVMAGPARPAGPSPGMKLLDTLDASDKRVQEALGGVRDANAESSAAAGDVGWGAQAANQEAIDRMGELQTVQQEHMSRAIDSVRQTRTEIDDELKNLPAIDPNRWFASKNTAGQLTSAIAVALGAAAQGISKGAVPNSALQIVQSAIDRDVEAQKANVTTKLSALQKKHEFMRDDWARATWQSDQMDRLKVEGLEKARLRLAGYTAQAQSANDKAKLAGLDAQIVGEVEKLTQGMATRRYQMQQAQATGGGGSSEAAMQQRYQKYAEGQLNKGETPIPWSQYRSTMMGNPQAQAPKPGAGSDPLSALAPKDRERGYLLPDGTVALAPTKEAAQQARELVNAHGAVKAGIAQAKELRAKHGGGFTGLPLVGDRADAQAAEQINKDLSVPLARLQGVEGAVGEAEADRARTRIGGDITKYGSSVDKALANADKWADEQFAAKIKQFGGRAAAAPAALPFGATPGIKR